MNWLRENAFWIVVGILFLGLHMKMHGGHGHGGHGHGGHGNGGHRHGGREDEERDSGSGDRAERPDRARSGGSHAGH